MDGDITMPNLISKDLFDETIAFIEGKKEPGLLLKEMQNWYSERGVILYNLYFEKDIYKNHDTYGKYNICILSDLFEGFIRHGSKKSIYKDSLDKFLQVCKSNCLYQDYEWANISYPKPGISGFYFPRIWRDEVIRDAGLSLCPEIEKKYAEYGVAKVVNSGYGVYTVFFRDAALDDKYDNYQSEIINYVKEYVLNFDKHHLIAKLDRIVQFDRLSVLEEVYQGNLYYYYK